MISLSLAKPATTGGTGRLVSKPLQLVAFETIKDIQSRNKTPVLVGGTHYYIESVLFEQKEEAHYYFQGEIDLKGMTAYDYLNSLDPLQA